MLPPSKRGKKSKQTKKPQTQTTRDGLMFCQECDGFGFCLYNFLLLKGKVETGDDGEG